MAEGLLGMASRVRVRRDGAAHAVLTPDKVPVIGVRTAGLIPVLQVAHLGHRPRLLHCPKTPLLAMSRFGRSGSSSNFGKRRSNRKTNWRRVPVATCRSLCRRVITVPPKRPRRSSVSPKPRIKRPRDRRRPIRTAPRVSLIEVRRPHTLCQIDRTAIILRTARCRSCQPTDEWW
jgi:hypothetical protein